MTSPELNDFIKINASFVEVSPGLFNTTIAGEKIDAAAGMVSTASDLMLYAEALYKGNFLSQESLNFLLSVGKGIENEEPNTVRQGIVTVRNKTYGVLYSSLGDGPGGMNVMLNYHPQSESIIIAFTNVFGNWDELDFMMDEIVPIIVSPLKFGDVAYLNNNGIE